MRETSSGPRESIPKTEKEVVVMTIDPQFHFTVRKWLVDALEANASWRDEKAAEYPDDPRNARAAGALRSAAMHTLHARESAGVDRFAELVEAAENSGVAFMSGHDFPGEAQQVASRYFFDNLPGNADFQTHERLLLELHDASVRSLGEWSIAHDSPLGRLIAQEKPSGPQAPELALLTEIRDLVREMRDRVVNVA
jgi:hypothetical protein